jgi:hypothetical protein
MLTSSSTSGSSNSASRPYERRHIRVSVNRWIACARSPLVASRNLSREMSFQTFGSQCAVPFNALPRLRFIRQPYRIMRETPELTSQNLSSSVNGDFFPVPPPYPPAQPRKYPLSNAASASLTGITSPGSEKWATTAASLPSCESLEVVEVLSFRLLECSDAMLAIEDRLELRPLARPIAAYWGVIYVVDERGRRQVGRHCLTRIYTSMYRCLLQDVLRYIPWGGRGDAVPTFLWK